MPKQPDNRHADYVSPNRVDRKEVNCGFLVFTFEDAEQASTAHDRLLTLGFTPLREDGRSTVMRCAEENALCIIRRMTEEGSIGEVHVSEHP